MHGSDSIVFNGMLAKGAFLDYDSTILYNNTFGILKFENIDGLKWYKIK